MPDESPVLSPSRMVRWFAIAAVIVFTVALYFRDGRRVPPLTGTPTATGQPANCPDASRNPCHAPRRERETCPRRLHRRRPREGDRAGAREGGPRGARERQRLGLDAPAARRGEAHDPDGQGPAGARGAASLLGPRSGDGRATALPPREDRIRSPDRGRVLLRLRGGTAFRAGGSGGDRKEDGGGGQGRLPVCTRGGGPPRGEAALQG